MCKAPNEGKITTFLRQCLTSPSAKADLSSLYSPSDLSVEQVEYEDMRTYHVYARCNLLHGVCPYCGCISNRVHSRYQRTITDLSVPLRLSISTPKVFPKSCETVVRIIAEKVIAAQKFRSGEVHGENITNQRTAAMPIAI